MPEPWAPLRGHAHQEVQLFGAPHAGLSDDFCMVDAGSLFLYCWADVKFELHLEVTA